MDYILVDTKNANHIRFDITVSSKPSAIKALEDEASRYVNSRKVLENLGSVGDVQPLSDGLTFYSFNDNERPEVDEIVNDVIDEGYKVLSESVDRVWNVEQKSFPDMKASILEAIDLHFDMERETLETAADGKTIAANSFLSQYVEAKIAFASGATTQEVNTDSGERVGLSESSWDNIYSSLKDDVTSIYNTKQNKINAIEGVPDGATATLINTWGNVKSTF